MDCPYCSQPGARRVFFKVRCPNAACPAYDPDMAGGRATGMSRAPSRGPDPALPGERPGVRLDPFGLLLDLAGLALIVLWALGRLPWGLVAGIGLVVAGTIFTVLRLLRRLRVEPASEPAVRPAAKPVSPAVSWVLWIAAYALFRFGQHAETAKPVLWAAAAGVALMAYLAGRRAEPGPAASDEVDDPELEELRRMERDEREGPFDATGSRAIEIRYRTAKGEDKTFVGDRTSLRRRRAHVTVRVATEGIRIALRADRIGNRAEVEGAIPA